MSNGNTVHSEKPILPLAPGRNNGARLTRGMTREERLFSKGNLERARKLIEIADSAAVEELPRLTFPDNPLAELINQKVKLIPLSDGTGYQGHCPLCHAFGFSLVVVGERFWCLSETCRRGQRFIQDQERKMYEVSPTTGGIEEWNALLTSWPGHFARGKTDYLQAMEQVQESLSDPWVWDATESPWYCDDELPPVVIPGHVAIAFETEAEPRVLPSPCPSEGPVPSSASLQCPSGGEASQSVSQGSACGVPSLGSGPPSSLPGTPNTSSGMPGPGGAGGGVCLGGEAPSHTSEIFEPVYEPPNDPVSAICDLGL